MIYPLLPLFLTQTLGATPAFLGIIEGFAESFSSFLKLGTGFVADRARDRSRWVLAGYSVSSLARPLIAFAQGPWGVFLVRAGDRLGKGIRTAPRDALLADSADPEMRGKAFGFHRGMDHAGAVVGSLVASVLLAFFVKDLRVIFLLAGIPSLVSIALVVFRVREVPQRIVPKKESFRFEIPAGKLRVYLAVLFIFLLSSASDVFLLLRLTDVGVPRELLPVIWTVFSLTKALTTMPFGALSDRIGRRHVILAGWFFYACVYAGFGFLNDPVAASVLFVAYGFFYGFTEGAEAGLIADLVPVEARGRAYGWYHFAQGAALLPANLIFGFIWNGAGAQMAFFVAGGTALTAALLLATIGIKQDLRPTPPLPK